MKEFGTYLRNTREAAELTLEDLHQRTRISLKNLRLIESGDFPSIPQTYVRAFVREYARTVGLEEDEIVASYNEAAEREKGIPPPPTPFDSSNLLPKVDDSVEFIHPSEQAPSHVEVDGKAEVESEEFTPPVRKSTYVRDGDAEAIDIRTSAQKTPQNPAASAPDSVVPSEPAQPKTGPTRHNAPDPREESVPEKRQSKGTARKAAAVTPPADASPPATGTPTPSEKVRPEGGQSPPLAAKQVTKKSAPLASQTVEPKPDAKQPLITAARKPETASPVKESVPPPAAIPPAAESGNEKRIIGVGMVIIALITISIYGIFYFSSDDSDAGEAIDSTSIKASIEAGRFIDSTQYALTELDLAPEDTASSIPIVPPDPVEAQKRVFAKDDSLVLEAFTSAPVWFSVKMDTLRTERGSLSSNEHRVWKARDYFMITLGDAGAVTFFLNGMEIGTLGEEGAVVKNFTLSRQQLNGN